MADLKDRVLAALSTVMDPDLHKDLVTLGMIRELKVEDSGKVSFQVCLTTPACPMKEKIRGDCEAALRKVDGISRFVIEMTAEVRQARPDQDKAAIEGVRNIIAVGSGKGGVGKSTTAVNIALALSREGAKVALLDADIYGPNVPTMLGVTGKPVVRDNRIIPMRGHGIDVMSMGFMVDENQPLIWRGPMLHGVLRQLLHDVLWGEQDYLIVDLPPGTGDVQLSLSQAVPLSGAVIVTTPQNVALQDARKGIAMFQKVNVPILGIVENMSYYLCPQCGHRDEIFSTGGGENASAKFSVPFLGRIPLNTQIREGMDAGMPVAVNEDTEFPAIYRGVAQRVAQQLAIISERARNPYAITPTG
ncbi:MAG: iron-sulfur cluster carrier protein ApbC [Candidatus Sumerlaeia bacterium]|nr:iron-sulfur cluster carrier protein ApbC [Candidatus Sumerlaeia bacterium]